MTSFSIAPQTREMLNLIDTNRRQIILTPIRQQLELKLRWEAQLRRVYNLLFSQSIIVSQSQVEKVLLSEENHNEDPVGKEIVFGRKSLQYIKSQYSLLPKDITFKDLESLAEVAAIAGFWKIDRKTFETLKNLLSYIQAGSEHPVVQVGLWYGQIFHIASSIEGVIKLAPLVGYMFLYKSWYEMRDLLVFDDGLIHSKSLFTKHLQVAWQEQNSSSFLNYFIEEFLRQTDEIIKKIHGHMQDPESFPSFTHLTARQQGILSLFDSPSTEITNRKVQKAFQISQITASRDLSKLVILGLLYPHGKGRSVYYTKI